MAGYEYKIVNKTVGSPWMCEYIDLYAGATDENDMLKSLPGMQEFVAV